MKVKLLLVCLAGLFIFSLAYDRNIANAESPVSGFRVGIVDIKKIFQECKRNDKYRELAIAEQDRIVKELEALRKEIEAEEAGVQVLKRDTEEYLIQIQAVMMKNAELQAKQEFYKKKLELQDQRQTEDLYGDILVKAKEVAESKGLALVLSLEEPTLPSLSANDLMLSMATHKVLYSGGCVNISEEVMALVDAMK
jgi:Skp family chaperone for outer membrane proteins